MSDTSHSFVALKKTDPSPTLLSRRNLKQLSLDIVSPTAQQQTTNHLDTNVSSLTDDASLRYSLDTTDINLLDQHEMELKSKDTTDKENESHNNTTTASPQQQKNTKRTPSSSSPLSTISTNTNTSEENAVHPYKVGSRVWVVWKEQELKATIQRFNRNGRPVIKWDGVKTRTTMDISDIKRFVVDNDEDETVSQTALTEVLVINDDEAPPKLVNEEDDTFEEKTEQEDNSNKTIIKDQVLTAQTEDDKSMKKASDANTTPPTEKVDEHTIDDNTKQSDKEDDIPDNNAPSALLMIEDLEQCLDDYLKSVDKAQEVVVAWSKRKDEIRKELENGLGVIDASVEPEPE